MTPSDSASDPRADLARHPFFAGLADSELAELAGCAVRREFPAGSPMTQEGDEARTFFALLHGKVAVQLHVPGRGLVTLQTLPAGEVLGWSWMLPPAKWTFDAHALQKTMVLEFDGAAVLRLCEAEPRLGFRLMTRMAKVMAGRLQAARLQLLDMYGTPRP
jgi:CRP-like cAMP-binding protein